MDEKELNQESFHYLKEKIKIKEKNTPESTSKKIKQIDENKENANFLNKNKLNIIPPIINYSKNNSKNQQINKNIQPKTNLYINTKIYYKTESDNQDINEDIQNSQRINTQTYEKDLIKRKTIIRGEEAKNVQITHIICSSKPSKFHITEKLSMKNIKTNPIQIHKSYRENQSKNGNGKSSYSSSCQDNIKHNIHNLKGKTTVYQHVRGIGMTNDKKGNINPLLYNSEIKKLEPIKKDKNKEKVEYIENFRSKKVINSKNKNIITNSYKNDNNIDNQYQVIIILIIFFLIIKLF